MKKAVIVAAGLSSRLYPLTEKLPKGLLPVGEQSILSRSIAILKANGITDIAVVVGFRHQQIRDALGDTVQYILNPFYQHCNNMGSLWFARDFVGNQPFVYLHGDLVFAPEVLASSQEGFASRNNDIELVTEFKDNDEEAMKVRVDPDNYLLESNKEIPLSQAQGEWIGMAWIRKTAVLFSRIEEILTKEGLNYYDTHAFTALARAGARVYCSPTTEPWVEVDFQQDYQLAQELFTRI